MEENKENIYYDQLACSVYFVEDIDKDGMVFIPFDFESEEIEEALFKILLIRKKHVSFKGHFDFPNRFLSKLDVFYTSLKKPFYVKLSNI